MTSQGKAVPEAGEAVDAADRSALFFTLADEAPDAVGVIAAVRDADGAHVGDRIVHMNATIRRRWLDDRPLRDVVGGDPYQLIPMLSRFRELGMQVIARREPHRSVHELPFPHGASRYVDLRMEPWGDGFWFVSRDVTAETLATVEGTADAAQTGILLRGALGTLGDLVSVLRAERDATGAITREVVVFANPAWRREFMGADVVDPAGRDLLEVAPSLADLTGIRRAVIETGETVRTSFATPRGHWLDVAYVRFGDGLIVVSRDNTEAHRAQDALRTSEAELAEAQRLAHVGSWRLDPVTGETTWSPEMLRIYGLDPDGPSPTFAEQARFYDPETIATVVEMVEDVSRTHGSHDLELDLHRDDGTVRRLQARIEAVVDGTGTFVAVRGTAADITDVRDTQMRLEQASRAEMVGRLAGGIAHDFNNVLAGIQGYADLLADTMSVSDPRLDDVNAIREGAARAATLTRQLLAFGRRQPLNEELVTPADVVDDLVPMLRRLVPATISVRTGHHGRPGRVLADRPQLEQAIVNLVINARDAMPAGGSITVETNCVTVTEDDVRRRDVPVGEHIRITVTDTGTGIDPEVLPRLFEPFFTTKGPGRGSGLGLSSVDGFVTQSRGFLAVDSEVGRGSTFAIHLPRVTESAVPATPVPAAVPSIAGSAGPRPAAAERVLLVEDEPGVRTMTARMLRDLGYTVIEAGDPGVALAVAEARPTSFDILVTDIVMPGMNGRELADILGRIRPGLPVLFVSAYPADQLAPSGPGEAGRALLAKPFRRAELAGHVRALLDGVQPPSG